jgi:hypothetical protein
VLTVLLPGIAAMVLLGRVLAVPGEVASAAPNAQASLHVQSVIAQLMLREAGLSSRQDALVLSAAEVNAFLAQHVEVRDAPVWPVQARIDPAGAELGGLATLGRLTEAGLGRTMAGWMPRALAGYPVWIAARGRIRVSPGGHAAFDAESARVGQQRVPVSLLWAVVGGRPRALTWSMPRVVDRIDVEAGRLVIHTRPPGSGRAAPGSPGSGSGGAQRLPRRAWLSRT